MSHKKPVLTEMQQRFVVNYIKNGFNIRQAARDAGYSESYAHVHSHKLMSHPAVREKLSKAYAIVEARQDRQLCMTLSEKAQVLSNIIYDIMPRDGSEPKRDYYKDAIAAIKELNKMQGDYAPDKRLSVTVDATKAKLEEAKRIYEEY